MGDLPQRRRLEIDVPDFLISREDQIATEDQNMIDAVLNNTPGNTSNEEINHLKALSEQARQFTDEEWKAIAPCIPDELLCDESKRRHIMRRKYIENSRNNLETLSTQQL